MESATNIACSVGITAYNEEANIGALLQRMLEQRMHRVELREIIVIASGVTDATEAIVQKFVARDPRVRLVVQRRREGKASAINLFIEQAAEKYLFLCSADLLPGMEAVEKLVAPLVDPNVGITSGRPVPVNDRNTFMGFAAHLMWELHHEINMRGFKAGEMVAFRKVFERIPPDTAVDEASVEPLIRGQGYQARYVPGVVVFNKGPDTVTEFLTQRRRIYAGHLKVKKNVGYAVSTMSGLRILALLLMTQSWNPKEFLWTWGVVTLEVYGRYLGWRDFRANRDHSIWTIAKTTKELTAQ